ncbi:hypothetical protein LTR53_019298, partial [Teratosphaeriaceae sp. CCFEE 6253]
LHLVASALDAIAKRACLPKIATRAPADGDAHGCQIDRTATSVHLLSRIHRPRRHLLATLPARAMPSAIARKKYGTDVNRYLGVEFPEDHIHVPEPTVSEDRHLDDTAVTTCTD